MTAQTDLFTLGALMYEMALGKRLFTGSNLVQLCQERLQGTWLLPHHRKQALANVVDANFAGIVADCLAHDPNKRPGSSTELIARLTDAAHRTPRRVRRHVIRPRRAA